MSPHRRQFPDLQAQLVILAPQAIQVRPAMLALLVTLEPLAMLVLQVTSVQQATLALPVTPVRPAIRATLLSSFSRLNNQP
jgi:hypothetical protein